MKVQRKLTDDELQDVMVARQVLRRIFSFASEAIVICQASSMVDAMAFHATTDGEPWVDPEPPMPEGYRKAVAGDEGRRDCKFLSTLATYRWIIRELSRVGMPFDAAFKYIVPIDRVPTDDEAKSRPEVMVRNERERWQRAVLVAVIPSAPYPFYVLDKECCPSCQYCRHLYPGE